MHLSKIAILAGGLALAGCAGSTDTRSVNALAIACDTYATALEQVTPYKAKMTANQIVRVDTANEVVGQACASDSTVDPREGVAVVSQGIALVQQIKEAF